MNIDNGKILIFENKKELIEKAVALWTRSASNALGDKDVFTVALSGGSTPIDLYKTLSTKKDTLPWEKTHVFIVDERFVPFTDEANNYRMINMSLLGPIGLDRNNIHLVSVEEDTVYASALEYESKMKRFFTLGEGEVPAFDLIMLGLGDDGHTASLFPGDRALDEKTRLTASVKAESLENDRITMTFPVINNANLVVFMISGKDKAEMAEKVIMRRDPSLPGSYVAPAEGELFFLLDEAAAEYIK